MPVDRRVRWERMAFDRARLNAWQSERLTELLRLILPANSFYAAKFADHLSGDAATWADATTWGIEQLTRLPLTTKSELVAGGDFAANLTWSPDRYVRFHRTSGTHGRPLAVLDTADDWDWWCDSWQYVLDQADCESGQRAMMAFSFGPFIGFWSAFDAATRRGMLVAPGGGLSTSARLGLIQSFRPHVLFCTPTYAQHLASQARAESLDPRALGVKKIIVAGEPGGSVPTIRSEIEQAWGAELVDHAGATEIGPWGFGDRAGKGIYVNEAEFIAEVIDRDSLEPVNDGELGELVLTSLGRVGAPVIRYRTGDMVRRRQRGPEACQFAWLEGGVLGRAYDMMIVRGVNVFPASLESIIRSVAGIDEYRIIAFKRGAMDALRIEFESCDAPASDRVASELAHRLEVRVGLRVDVSVLPAGSLPRSDGKSKRFVDQRLS